MNKRRERFKKKKAEWKQKNPKGAVNGKANGQENAQNGGGEI